MTNRRAIIGFNAVAGVLKRSPGSVERLYVLDTLGAKRRRRLEQLLVGLSLKAEAIDGARLRSIAGGDQHQGVAALVAAPDPLDDDAALELIEQASCPLLLVLDGVEDPRNFGACLRTANAAGADLVITARQRSAPITPAVSKVAAGAAETQALARVANLARFLTQIRQLDVQLIGAADAAATSLYDADLSVPTALVLGSEGHGLRRLTRERCDQLVALPMHGTVESLNVAVAAGICLYEGVRQRRLAGPGSVR